jgi:DNA-3-methyladenine glycosylase I
MNDAPIQRCAWAQHPAMQVYHDLEWGEPVHDDRTLFEFLVLEGAQAGLSWDTILRKRDNYRAAFANFDPAVVAAYDEATIARLLEDPGIVRHRRKLQSAVDNARAVLAVQAEFGSLDAFLWSFVGGRPIRNQWRSLAEIPVQTAESQAMSKALKRRGFGFVGPTTCYAFMEAVGMVNDHEVSCYRWAALDAAAREAA